GWWSATRRLRAASNAAANGTAWPIHGCTARARVTEAATCQYHVLTSTAATEGGKGLCGRESSAGTPERDVVSVAHHPDSNVDPERVPLRREPLKVLGIVAFPLPTVRRVAIEAHQHHQPAVLPDDRVQVRRTGAELVGPAAAPAPRFDAWDLRDLVHVVEHREERMTRGDFDNRIFGKNPDQVRPDVFPIRFSPVVVLPQEAALEEVPAERGDLLVGEIVVRAALHLQVRTVEQVRIVERDLCEARIAVRPAADRNGGEFFEAGQKVEIRSRVVIPPTALALAASALVAQTAEREATLDVGKTVVHREGTLASLRNDRDLPGRSTQRHGQKDGDAQGDHCTGCSAESASRAHIVTTSNCTAAFACHALDPSRPTSSAQPCATKPPRRRNQKSRLKIHLDAPAVDRGGRSERPHRIEPEPPRVQAGAADAAALRRPSTFCAVKASSPRFDAPSCMG